MMYLDTKPSRGLIAILISRVLLNVVGGLLGIFTPIVIYTILQQNIQWTFLYFAVCAFAFLFFLPLLIRYVDAIGFKYSLMASAVVGAIYNFLFYAHDTAMLGASGFVILTIIFLTMYRTTYWSPFHTEFVALSDVSHRGRHISIFDASAMIVNIFLPFISALLITWYGFDFVFALSVGVMLLSGLPYIMMPRIPETFSWSVAQTWKQFTCRLRSKVALAFIAEGVEDIIALYLWPIFLYQLFDGNLLDVGGVSTVILLVSILLQLFVGTLIDTKHTDQTLRWGSLLYALGWIAKMFVLTITHVFVVGVYHTISKIFTQAPRESVAYDVSSQRDAYVDEYTVLREMYVNTGRCLGAVLALVLSLYVPIQWLFSIGVVASLIFQLIAARDFNRTTCMM